MKITSKILAIVLLFIFAGCESQLDIDQHGVFVSMDEFYQTDEDALSASAAIYNSTSAVYFNWSYLKNFLSDDVWTGGSGPTDNPDHRSANEYTLGTDHPTIEGLYQGLYSVIFNANLVIENMEGNTEEKKRVIAEAKFFRAFAHFELVTLWGTAPVIDHVLPAQNPEVVNGTPQQAWTLIEQDLIEACPDLPKKSGINDNSAIVNRVTWGAAMSYLGKAYVFQEKWSDAASILNEVINSAQYELVAGSEYDYLTHSRLDNSSEAVLELQVTNDAANAGWSFNYLMSGWRAVWFSGVSDANTYTINLIDGWGFLHPRKDLYDAFVEVETATGQRLNKTIMTLDQVISSGLATGLATNVFGNEGYFNWKCRMLFEDLIYPVPGFNAFQHINNRIMRYAEVLLLAAEANLEAGNTNEALTCINEVRTRAGLPDLTAITLEDIKKEKRLELCFESIRYQDLIRWGDAEKVLADQGKVVKTLTVTDGVIDEITQPNAGFKAKNLLLPIPAKEILVNPAMKQNKGW